MTNDVTYEDIAAARERIAGDLYYSPCPPSIPLSEATGCQIFCKLDYLQRTGSFKERGARNALGLLTRDERERGVIAASAGNHALGLAYHGHRLGIPITVVMPRNAPLIKVSTCNRLGARVIQHGQNFSDAFELATKMAADEALHFVAAFDDPAVIAGQGTMGLEIMEQASEIDAIVVPVGGGGLITGIALAVKRRLPSVKIIGVEPAFAASLTAARRSGHPEPAALRSTLADGLAVSTLGNIPFRIGMPLIDDVVEVTEDEIALAMLRLVELEKGVVEGAGAAPLAALLAHKLPSLAGKRVVLPLCGGNVDPNVLSRVIQMGLVADGRLSRFTVIVSDAPGSLADFCGVIAEAGASIKQIDHERAFAGPDVSAVEVQCVIETRDRDHMRAVYKRLTSSGFTVYQGDQNLAPIAVG